MDETERQKLVAGIKAAIEDQNKPIQTRMAELEKLAPRLMELEQKYAGTGSMHPHGVLGVGPDPFANESFTSRVKAVNEGQPTSGRILLPGMRLKALKALVSGPGIDSPSSVVATPAQRGPMVGPVVRPLTLIDVLPSIPVTSNKFEHVRITRTNNADVQENEGDQKPESSFESELLTASIATIAHWTQASRQVLADNPQLTNILRNILSLDALDKFETELLLGDGTDGHILGLIPQAITLATDEPLAPDAISQGLAIMFTNGYIANAVALHPKTWHEIRTMKGDGDGQYLVGSWANPAAPNIWNTPVVQNSAVPQGNALLIDSTRLTVLDREQVQVMVSTEDRDNFVKNLVTLLAELRGGLAVYDTGGLGYVDLPHPATGTG